MPKNAPRVELLYFEDCPNWKTADDRLRALGEARGFDLEHRLVTSQAEAEKAGFRGSPTVFIDGRDPFASGDEAFGLSCRVYQTPDGLAGAPTIAQLEAAIDG